MTETRSFKTLFYLILIQRYIFFALVVLLPLFYCLSRLVWAASAINDRIKVYQYINRILNSFKTAYFTIGFIYCFLCFNSYLVSLLG